MFRKSATGWLVMAAAFVFSSTLAAQLIDNNKAPNVANGGIARPLISGAYPTQVFDGRLGSDPNTSLNVIRFDPFRAVRRGRQLFQRKFTRSEGQGPLSHDGSGDIANDLSIGAGLSDSCAGCHGRPRGSAGFGGDVATRPDSRDAPHLFGLGLKEMLADEITADLRAIRAQAIADARRFGRSVRRSLNSKGINYGDITAFPNGNVNTSDVEGVDTDLRVRPFFTHGETISIREFAVGAFKAEMGINAAGDPDLVAAQTGRVVTPAGMVLDGRADKIEKAPADEQGDIGTINQRTAMIDFMEFYLLNYFKPALGNVTTDVNSGFSIFQQIGCASCHVQNLTINRDRRVADVETRFDSTNGNPFNRMFATATPLLANPASIGQAGEAKIPAFGSFQVRNIFTDFKRHDLGPNFHERNYDGTIRREFLTTALWGVGATGPYGHDGRSGTLTDVILRHGGEAQTERDRFAGLSSTNRRLLLEFLNVLMLFGPDDTASNLDPKVPTTSGFPQFGHGSIRLTGLFNNPAIIE